MGTMHQDADLDFQSISKIVNLPAPIAGSNSPVRQIDHESAISALTTSLTTRSPSTTNLALMIIGQIASGQWVDNAFSSTTYINGVVDLCTAIQNLDHYLSLTATQSQTANDAIAALSTDSISIRGA